MKVLLTNITTWVLKHQAFVFKTGYNFMSVSNSHMHIHIFFKYFQILKLNSYKFEEKEKDFCPMLNKFVARK